MSVRRMWRHPRASSCISLPLRALDREFVIAGARLRRGDWGSIACGGVERTAGFNAIAPELPRCLLRCATATQRTVLSPQMIMAGLAYYTPADPLSFVEACMQRARDKIQPGEPFRELPWDLFVSEGETFGAFCAFQSCSSTAAFAGVSCRGGNVTL